MSISEWNHLPGIITIFIFKEQDAFQLISDQFKDQTVLANKYFNTLAEGGELTLGQQHDLINAVNDITSGLDRVWV